MKFEDLGAAYANNEGMDEVIEDNEEPTIENEDSNGKGPDSLKEAYANNEGMEEVIEDNENLTETRSFEDIGREKLGIASEKASALFDNLLEKGKKTIYNAVGVAFELPKIANETKEVAIEAGTQAYGEAKEVFTGAVNSAKEKVQEVKTNLVERAEKAKTSFFEKITADGKGKVVSFDRWGKYRLAYPVQKNDYGIYMLVRYELPREAVEDAFKELDTFFRIKCNLNTF